MKTSELIRYFNDEFDSRNYQVVLLVDNSGDQSSSKEKLYDAGIIRAFKAHYIQILFNHLVKQIEETNRERLI